jgi:myo-inositol-1(or 4)-monophosphatase
LPAGDDLALLLEAARLGGETALRYWRASPTAWEKGGGQGPVSEADILVDGILSDVLRSARPNYGWLSEESEDDPARLNAESVFVVDPIDGTRSYLEGRATWAVSIAVAVRGSIEAAVVALPARGTLYMAARGSGARRDGLAIQASRREEIEDALVLAPRVALAPETWGNRGAPPVERHFRPSLAYRLCLVAEGRFDAMMTFRDCWEWDIAAGALVAAEAGAKVTDRFGAALTFNSPRATTAGAIASAPGIHGALLAPGYMS